MPSFLASNTVQLPRSPRSAAEKTNEALRNLNEELRSYEDARIEFQDGELVVVKKNEGSRKRKSRAQSTSDDDDDDDLSLPRGSRKRPHVIEDSDSDSDADYDDSGDEMGLDGEDNIQTFQESEDEETDADDSANTQDQGIGSIERRFIYSMDDDRLGSPSPDTGITAEELEERRGRLDQRIRGLLRSLKKFSQSQPDTFVTRFRNLLRNGENKLSRMVMKGIPATTIEVLGKQHFTIEELFMLLLGTVTEPEVITEKGSRFCFDSLYRTVAAVQQECDITALAPGLNSTWTFKQGWRGSSYKVRARCVDCLRSIPEKSDPDWNVKSWRYLDQESPSPEKVMCLNCHNYRKQGKLRTPADEEKRVNSDRSYAHGPGRPSDGQCQLSYCSALLPTENGEQTYIGVSAGQEFGMYLCKRHWLQRKNGVLSLERDVGKKLQPQLPADGLCEMANCQNTLPAKSPWIGKRKGLTINLHLCKAHEAMANKGKLVLN